MAAPRMMIVAGPPGAGKSSMFALTDLAEHVFNADDRAAVLNNGSYRNIPIEIREAVNQEFEAFVHKSIDDKQSFALESTLRSDITFEQAKLAQKKGFRVSMIYVALDSVEKHIERVKERAALGGHAASEATLRKIHADSLGNLPTGLDTKRSGIEHVEVYDNSKRDAGPTLIAVSVRGSIRELASEVPGWFQNAMGPEGFTEHPKIHRACSPLTSSAKVRN